MGQRAGRDSSDRLSQRCISFLLFFAVVQGRRTKFRFLSIFTDMSSLADGESSSSSPELKQGEQEAPADAGKSGVKVDSPHKRSSTKADKHEKKKKKKKKSKKSKRDKRRVTEVGLPIEAGAGSGETAKSAGQSAHAEPVPVSKTPDDGSLEELLRRSGVGGGGASRHPGEKSVAPSSADSMSSSAQKASTSTTRGANIAAAALVSSFQRSQSHQQLTKLQDALRKQFTCALCRDLLYKPVTTPCGHSFCQACLLHMAATGGNLIAAAAGATPGSAEAAVRDESSYSGVLKDFKCPICRTELPGCVAQTGVSVVLWDAVNSVFKGYAWQRRSEHEAELAHARALPVGAWATYYRQRIGAIVDRIEEGREVHGSFDGHDDSTTAAGGGGEAATDNLSSNRMNRRVIKEQRDGRVVCQEIRVHPDDRFRRHAVAFVRFPRGEILVRSFVLPPQFVAPSLAARTVAMQSKSTIMSIELEELPLPTFDLEMLLILYAFGSVYPNPLR